MKQDQIGFEVLGEIRRAVLTAKEVDPNRGVDQDHRAPSRIGSRRREATSTRPADAWRRYAGKCPRSAELARQDQLQHLFIWSPAITSSTWRGRRTYFYGMTGATRCRSTQYAQATISHIDKAPHAIGRGSGGGGGPNAPKSQKAASAARRT